MNNLLATGVILFCFCPLWGNVLSAHWFDDRRISQLLFMLVGLTIVCFFLYTSSWRVLKMMWMKLHSKALLVFLAIVLAPAIIRGWFNWEEIGKYNIGVPFCFIIFVTSLITYVQSKFAFLKSSLETVDQSRNSFLYQCLGVIGYCICFKAWYLGPVIYDAGPSVLNFGGNYIFASTATCTIYGIIILRSRHHLNFILSLPWLYLTLFQLSRTALLLLLILWIFYGCRILFHFKRPFRMAVFNIASHNLVAITILLLPTVFQSDYFPYLIRGEEAELSRLHSRGSLLFSVLRIVRPIVDIDSLDFEYIRLMKEEVDQSRSQLAIHPKTPSKVQQQLSSFKWKKEARSSLFIDSININKQFPLGAWPLPYSRFSSIACEINQKCAYPHNLIMDFSFAFGWIPGIVSFVLTVGLIVSLVVHILHGSGTRLILSCVCFAIVLILLVSGTFSEQPLLILPIIALIALFSFDHKDQLLVESDQIPVTQNED